MSASFNNWNKPIPAQKPLGNIAMGHIQRPPNLYIPKMSFHDVRPTTHEMPLKTNSNRPSNAPNRRDSSSTSSLKQQMKPILTINTQPSYPFIQQNQLSTQPTISHQSTTKSQHANYTSMLHFLHKTPPSHNLLADTFTWLLLAGFILVPGTFTSLDDTNLNYTEKKFHGSFKHIGLITLASVISTCGLLGMGWLWSKHRSNFIWLCDRIFLPGVLNSSVGILGTLVGVYWSQEGKWCTSAEVTVAVEVAVWGFCGVLWMFYYFVKLGKLKRMHVEETGKDMPLGLGIKDVGGMV